ncbi:flippase-like domain-containing protein [Roseiconus nitratireducens]|uniref:Flippase-like domain-containing protein n=1 Tax=Roseiconus nitratireducens TaxID=2605748 RepID=A0A5M6CY72_9BACT|nr:lysylphosphatidylglycerol synthase domain-containing protein [Roseiconus nitratireducens]KAA5539886.1 flippase-like domain-containing protein [Roseiconus nitratireducens]
MRELKRVAKVLIALIVVVGLTVATHRAIQQWQEQSRRAEERVEEIERRIAASSSLAEREHLSADRRAASAAIPSLTNLRWSCISAAALLYFVGLVPGGVVLSEGVRTFGCRVPLREAVIAQVMGHLGKYVPGKAMVVVIRAARLSASGVPVSIGTTAVFLETLLMMAVGAAWGGALICLLPVPRWMAVLALVGGISASVPTVPPLLRRLVARIGVSKLATQADSDLGTPDPVAESIAEVPANPTGGWRYFRAAWFWQTIAWALIGGSFALLVASIPGRDGETFGVVATAASIAAICLAMVVGFASLLPGGAGIRELTLIVVLGPVVGESRALLAAIAARLLFIVVELVAAGVVTSAQRWKGGERLDPAT